MPISARNQIKGTVTNITQGDAIANVEIDAGGLRLVSSITVEAVRSSDSAKEPRSRRSSRRRTCSST